MFFQSKSNLYKKGPDFEIVTSVLSNGSENETEKIKLIIKNPESITDTYYDVIFKNLISIVYFNLQICFIY